MSKRLFLAFDLAIQVVEKMVVWRQSLDDHLEAHERRWVDPEHIRLTLAYLGPTEDALIDLICEHIAELIRVTPIPPFQISCQGIEMTPDAAPQHLWATLDDKSAEIIGLLQRVITRELEQLGLSPDPRTFRPHVMLGRLIAGHQRDLAQALPPSEQPGFGSCYIKDLALFEARVTRESHDFLVIERFPLGAT